MNRGLFWVAAAVVVGFAYIAGYLTGCPEKSAEDPKAAINAVTNSVGANLNARTNVVTKVAPSAEPVVKNLPPRMAVVRTEYDGDATLAVFLSERPDMKVAREYVSVGPMKSGTYGVSYQARYDPRSCKYDQSVLTITGDFAYRTNLTLRLRKGLPLFAAGKVAEGEGSLSEDYVFEFKRKDAAPSVSFVARGRYLPPVGRRMVEVESMNVSNVVAEIRRIEPRNVVQLLAREERQYNGKWTGTADEEETEELSGEGESRELRCQNVPNRSEKNRLAVKMDDGGPANGMYLVMIRNGDLDRNDCRWWGTYNPNRYRVVCVSDLGLSVRESGEDVGVWVTSLTTGAPVAGAKVEVYSSANTLIAEGCSDANGWCAPTRCAKGSAFAVVARSASGDDMTFLALMNSMTVSEDENNGSRERYLEEKECTAFVWTERGIYRHDEKIFVHGLLRDGTMKAPKPMPLELELRGPDGKPVSRCSMMSDENGVVMCEGFTVPAERPSGEWTMVAKIPGKNGETLGSRKVKIEEFAPPQIRVRIAADETRHPSNLTFRIAAEHLFGGPARQLDCEGAVVFEDVAFAPVTWKGWSFGNETLGLKPNYRKLAQRTLDDAGETEYAAPLFADTGLPKAAIRATFEGTVFEDGGRPATARKAIVTHCYPYYIGSSLGDWVRLPEVGEAEIDFALVGTNGLAVIGEHSLTARLERIDCVYNYQRNEQGEHVWDSTRVNTTLVPGVEIRTDGEGRARYRLPVKECGDYVLTVTDGAGGSFGRRFYLSSWGDDVVRAPLADPTEVTLTVDKPFYRVGETPRVLVKAPFAGWAMLSVMRDKEVYSQIVNLTNTTSEIALRPVTREHAPNLDVYLSVVQSVSANTKHLAARAHGQTTVAVRPIENEIAVKVTQTLCGQRLSVDVEAEGATSAVVTVVDEGINLLTEEKTPDPVGCFAAARGAVHPLYDIFHRVLPVVDENLRVSGVKTGGGFGAEMLGRVSPEPTRRFVPLALWEKNVAIREGKGRVVFELPEFVGEIRVTAVAYSDRASGSASVNRKIAPNLVMQPDAPRFVAPGDAFTVTLPIRNMTKEAGEVYYEVFADRSREDARSTEESACDTIVPRAPSRGIVLGAGSSTNVVLTMKAPNTQGQLSVHYIARGLGEAHKKTIEVPVRPAVAWRETTGVARVEDEATLRAALKDGERFAVKRCETPTDELVSAYQWLAEYPHGCLEQTSSRIFPLLSGGLGVVSNRADYVEAGVRRVESMIRENDFVMWPDCNYAPWDREVSLYAAHFLIEAERSGVKLADSAKGKVLGFLAKWAVSSNDCVSAYACHDLALAGKPDRDRMLRLYDRTASLDALTRARLARAFALDHDFKRAEKILSQAYDPQDVREAAFTVLALLEVNPDDARIFPLVEYLMKNRERGRFSWGTTGENAHALLAIGAYYRAHPGKEKEPYLLWRKFTLPEESEVVDDSSGIFIAREYYHANGERAELGDLVCGEMLIVELTLTTDVTRVVNDLVIEDLFPACFEPVVGSVAARGGARGTEEDWVMRKDARDDRMLVFSKRFNLEKDNGVKVRYPVRVVTAGDFVLPGPSVEGMYNPRLHSRRAPGRLVVRH